MRLNRIGAAVLVVIGAVVFGMVFVKQFNVNRTALSESLRDDNALYRPEVAGATVNRPNSRPDQPAQIDQSVGSVNLNSIDNGSAQIEEQLKLLDQ